MTTRTSTASRHLVRAVATTGVVCGSGASLGWAIGSVARSVAGNRMAPWIIGRASGITAYALFTGLVLMGLSLSHPRRVSLRRPGVPTLIRAHITLATFTLAFVVVHVVVLATDRFAGVGRWGALLPLAAQYRPVAVTFGVIGMWAGLVAGLTAAVAHRLPLRMWWPLHKVAGVSYALVWLHGVLAGADTRALWWMYVGTGAGVVVVATSRYMSRTPVDVAHERAELVASSR